MASNLYPIPADVLERATFRKSRRSDPNGNCVEVAEVDGNYYVRDSSNPAAAVLAFSSGEWVAWPTVSSSCKQNSHGTKRPRSIW